MFGACRGICEAPDAPGTLPKGARNLYREQDTIVFRLNPIRGVFAIRKKQFRPSLGPFPFLLGLYCSMFGTCWGTCEAPDSPRTLPQGTQKPLFPNRGSLRPEKHNSEYRLLVFGLFGHRIFEK